MFERWKDIPGYEGLYQVSNKGRVRSLDRVVPLGDSGATRLHRGVVLKPVTQHTGYSLVTLCRNGRTKGVLVHRVVMLSFVGPSRLQVNHIDGDKSNNSLSNLEYCTQDENMKHASRNGLMPTGERNVFSKLTESQVGRIRKLYATGNMTQKSIAHSFGVTRETVNSIVNYKTWKHTK